MFQASNFYMHRYSVLFLLCSTLTVFCGCRDTEIKQQQNAHHDSTLTSPLKGKKVLYIDSYHPEYMHSKIVQHTTQKSLENHGAIVKTVYLDAKREKSDNELKQAGSK